MKIAIVDDNIKRNGEIRKLLIEQCNLNEEDVSSYFNTQDAKTAMRNITFNVLILDVILPKRDERASAEAGLKLLSDVTKNVKLKKPNRIIGITASESDIGKFKDEFENDCLTVIEATNSNKSWKSKIVKSVGYEINSVLSKATKDSEVLCLTIHGIRTRGVKWHS